MSASATTTDRLIQIQTALLGIAVAILVGGIPWAYSLHGRVTTVETNTTRGADDLKLLSADVKSLALNAAKLDSLERRIDRLEARMP